MYTPRPAFVVATMLLLACCSLVHGQTQAPTNLFAQAIVGEGTAASLTWQSFAPSFGNMITGFEIHRALSITLQFVKVDLVPSSVTTYRMSGMEPYTKYQIKVGAVMSSGNTVFSNTIEFTTGGLPVGIQGLMIGPSPTCAECALLTWSRFSPAGLIVNGIQVQQAVGDSSYVAATQESPASDSYTTRPLVANWNYKFRVVAVLSPSGVTAPSNEVTFKLGQVTSNNLQAPSGLRGEISASNPLMASLTWDAYNPPSGPSSIIGYEIFQASGTSSSAVFVTVKTTQQMATSAQILLETSGFFQFKIRCWIESGATPFSNPVTVQVSAAATQGPAGLKVTPNNEDVTRLTLSWDFFSPSTGAVEGYQVYQAISPNSDYVLIGSTFRFNQVIEVQNILPETNYLFKVRATLSGSAQPFSAYSSPLSFRSQDKPKAPTNLRVSATDEDSSCQLSWSPYLVIDARQASGYEVYQTEGDANASNAASYVFVAKTEAYNQALKVSKLELGKTYYFKVRALLTGSVASATDFSTSVKFATKKAVEGLQYNVISANSITLFWNPFIPLAANGGGVVDSYEVYQGEDGQNFVMVKTTNAFQQGCEIVNLDLGVNFSFRVRAKLSTSQGVSYSPYSTILNYQTGFSTAASGLVVKADPKGGYSSVVCTWRTFNPGAGKSVLRYSVEIAGGLNELWSVIGTTSPTDQDLTIDNLLPSTAYLFKFRAELSNGYSDYSPSVPFTTAPKTVAAPTGLRFQFINENSGSLSWDLFQPSAGQQVTGYEVWTAIESLNTDFSLVTTSPGSAFLAIIEQLQPLTKYRVKVRAVLSAGYSAFSAVSSFTTTNFDSRPPSTPTLLSVVPAGVGLQLSWTASDGHGSAVSYAVYMSSSATATYNLAGTSKDLSVLVDTTDGMSFGKTYFFKVQAISDAGGVKGGFSNAVSSFYAIPTLPVPIDLAIAILGSTTAELSWFVRGGAGGLQFEVQRAEASTPSSVPPTNFVTVATVTGLSAMQSGLNPDKVYWFKIRSVVDAAHVSEFAQPISVQTKYATGTVAIREASMVTDSSLKVTWSVLTSGSAAYPIIGYDLVRGAGDVSPQLAEYVSVGVFRTAEGIDSGVATMQQYRYKVRAVNDIGSGAWSEPFLVKTGPLPPSMLQYVLTGTGANSAVDLTWKASPSAVSPNFEVLEVINKADGTSRSTTYTTTALFLKVTTLADAATHIFTVRAFAQNFGFSAPSNAVTVSLASSDMCRDGIRNQGELQVDCGGSSPCKPCNSCSNRIWDLGEAFTDCGGVCPPCGANGSGVSAAPSWRLSLVTSLLSSALATAVALAMGIFLL